MGLNIGLNSITSGGLMMAAILLVLMGMLLVTASNKIADNPLFDQSSGLQDGKSKLQTAYILAFSAAAVVLLLAVLYGGHDMWWSPNEWIHTIIFLVVIILLVIVFIYAYGVLDGLYTPELENRNGADLFTWAALLFGVVGFLVVLAMASGRVGYHLVKSNVTDRFHELEHKVHLSHSHLTGNEIDYDFIGAEDPRKVLAPPSNPRPRRCAPPNRDASQCLPCQLPRDRANLAPPNTNMPY